MTFAYLDVYIFYDSKQGMEQGKVNNVNAHVVRMISNINELTPKLDHQNFPCFYVYFQELCSPKSVVAFFRGYSQFKCQKHLKKGYQ